MASIFTETPGHRCRSRYVYDEAKIRREGVKQSYNCGEISNKTKYGNFPLLAETAGPPHVFTGFYKSSTYSDYNRNTLFMFNMLKTPGSQS